MDTVSKTKKIFKFIRVFLFSAVLFFAVTVPFHKLFAVFTASEVRLSAALYPFLGINYGLPAALGIMTANFISDAVNGYSASVLIQGLLPQFLYAMVPRVVWRYFVRNEKHKHRLDSVKRVLQFTFVCFLSAIMAAIIVGYLCMINYGLDMVQVGKFVFLNNFEISIIFGCPLMVVANQVASRRFGIDKSITINEKIIVRAAIIEVIVLLILVYSMYKHTTTLGTYDIWNSIYFCIIGVIAFMFIMTLIVMIIFEKILKKEKQK